MANKVLHAKLTRNTDSVAIMQQLESQFISQPKPALVKTLAVKSKPVQKPKPKFDVITQQLLDDWRIINDMSGDRFEVFCGRLLTEYGFVNVERIGRTGDQGVDLLATWGDIRYAIQCKRYKNALGNTAVQEVFAGKSFYQCDIAVVLTNSTFTKGAIELASKIGVELWDGRRLSQYMNIVMQKALKKAAAGD